MPPPSCEPGLIPSAKIEGHFDGFGGGFGGEGGEGLGVVGEGEGVGEEGGEVNLFMGEEVEEEVNGVGGSALEGLGGEGVGADDGQLLEVMGRVFTALGL